MPSQSTLSSDEKAKVKSTIPVSSTANKIFFATLARIYYAYPNPEEWSYAGLQGALAFVKDQTKGTLSFKLVDLDGTRGIIWEHELYSGLEYHADRAFFHSFAGDDCMIGFVFANESEAKSFWKKVLDKKDAKSNKPATEKKKKSGKNGKIDKSMISAPKTDSFVHVAHMGYDADKGFTSEGVDPSWTAFLGQLESSGVGKDVIAREMDFIKDFTRNYQANQQKTKETPKKTKPPTPPSRRKNDATSSTSTPPPAPPSRNQRASQPPQPPSRPSQPPPPSRLSQPPPPPSRPSQPPPPPSRASTVPQPQPPPRPVSHAPAPPARPQKPNAVAPAPPARPTSSAPSVPPRAVPTAPPPPPSSSGAVPPPPPPPPPPPASSGVPPPPPPPPPPAAANGGNVLSTMPPAQPGRADLLASIQGKGIHSLKKTDSNDTPRSASMSPTEESSTAGAAASGGANDLATALAEALTQRNKKLGDSDDEEEDDDDWD